MRWRYETTDRWGTPTKFSTFSEMKDALEEVCRKNPADFQMPDELREGVDFVEIGVDGVEEHCRAIVRMLADDGRRHGKASMLDAIRLVEGCERRGTDAALAIADEMRKLDDGGQAAAGYEAAFFDFPNCPGCRMDWDNVDDMELCDPIIDTAELLVQAEELLERLKKA